MKLLILLFLMHTALVSAHTIRVATFNVSMEADNYAHSDTSPTGDELFIALKGGENPQIKNVAEILQRVRPDIVLLNEFDYSDNPEQGPKAFIRNYLSKSQNGAKPISYPYFYQAAVNTGVDSGVDLNNDGLKTGVESDAFGYGKYPGQYGMVLLSKFPILLSEVRTFQYFLWKDMPDNLLSSIVSEDGQQWYSQVAQNVLRLSSKSHWDVPVDVNGKTVHIFASHPTPPVFDGPENRNGKRNHDEIRFWHDYITSGKTAEYIYDDKKQVGGFKGERFVIVGDLNSSPNEGDSIHSAITGLIAHPKMMEDSKPTSAGGLKNDPSNPHSAYHTAAWKMRVDYVLPSLFGWKKTGQGVFWPLANSPLYRLIESRAASSDHRLVYLDLNLKH